MLYPDLGSTSNQLNVRGRKVLPNGGSRSSIQSAPYTIFLDACRGKHIVDVDGNKYVDFNNNYTSLIHGHCHPKIVEATTRQIAKGSAFALVALLRLNLPNYFVSVCPSLSRYVL